MLRLLIVTLFGAVAAVSGGKVGLAVDIPILNAGFEDPELDDGTWATGGADWEFGVYYWDDRTQWIKGADGSDTDAGVWNPDTAIGFSDGAYADENTGWAFSQIDIDAGLSQILEDSLQADTEYQLQVQVGNPFYNQTDDTADYRIELLAGDVLLESDTGASPEAGSWALHSLTYSSGANPAQAGQPLGIRLIAVEYADCIDGGCEVDFDEVSLTAQSASAPSLCDPNSQGDLDGNGKVEFADFLVLAENFGSDTSDQTVGDIDCNGKVEFADFLILAENFGTDVGNASSVPEPSSLALFAAVGLLGGFVHRRRR